MKKIEQEKKEKQYVYVCEKCKYKNRSEMNIVCLQCAFSGDNKNFEEEKQ